MLLLAVVALVVVPNTCVVQPVQALSVPRVKGGARPTTTKSSTPFKAAAATAEAAEPSGEPGTGTATIPNEVL